MAWKHGEVVYGWGVLSSRLAASRAQADPRGGGAVYYLPNQGVWVKIHNQGGDARGPFYIEIHRQCPCGGG